MTPGVIRICSPPCSRPLQVEAKSFRTTFWGLVGEGRGGASVPGGPSPPALPFRALADILRQQGPVPVSQYEHENMAVMDGSPKDETPVRTSKNHYTPVHSKAPNHGRSIPRDVDLRIFSLALTNRNREQQCQGGRGMLQPQPAALPRAGRELAVVLKCRSVGVPGT